MVKKTNRKNCGGNKYRMFYFNLLLLHMSTICIHKRNQTYSLSHRPCPPPHTALTCCTMMTCFSKELMYIFLFTETFSMMQMFIEDPDFFLYLSFPPFLFFFHTSAFSLLCPRLKETSCLPEVHEIQTERVITWLTDIDLISTKLHFSAHGIL